MEMARGWGQSVGLFTTEGVIDEFQPTDDYWARRRDRLPGVHPSQLQPAKRSPATRGQPRALRLPLPDELVRPSVLRESQFVKVHDNGRELLVASCSQ